MFSLEGDVPACRLPAGEAGQAGEGQRVNKGRISVYLVNFKKLKVQKASKNNNYLYNINLWERARELRKKGTKAEAYLWKFALKKRIQGYKFLRQRPVINYTDLKVYFKNAS